MILRFPLSAVRYGPPGSVCSRCLRSRTVLHETRRAFAITPSSRSLTAGSISPPRWRSGYFLDNGFLKHAKHTEKRQAVTSTENEASITPNITNSLQASTSNLPSKVPQELPHRRRQKARQDASASIPDPVIPPDASSVLTTVSSRLPVNSIRRTLSTLLALSKPRLSFLIILTTTSAYSLYPVPTLLSPAITETPSLSALTLLFLSAGTALTCASANTFNMLYEPKWDAMMSRTKNRPLVRGLISPRNALLFAIISGISGVSALYFGVNPTVAFLGGFNIFLYAAVYTPLKRISVINTWAGAVVGGIPPLMGWAAAAGQTATGSGNWQDLLFGEQSVGGWLLAALLFAWQFPHFMALSWSIREEYKNAGYKMLAWTNPARNGRVALRYSLFFFPICIALCYTGVTDWAFAVTSAPANAWLMREAYRFWKFEGLQGSARSLFWASVWHLPVLMVLAMVEKKGLWARIWRAAIGEPEVDDDEWIEADEEEFVIPTSSKSSSAAALVR